MEHGGKRRGAGRKTTEKEVEQKTLAAGKRRGRGRAAPRPAPTIASVVETAKADPSLINQVRRKEHGGRRRGAGRKTVEQETRVAGGGRPGAAAAPPLVPSEPPPQTPEEYLGVIMNDPENPLQTRMEAAELLMRYGRGGPGRGKKAAADEAARIASRGRFATPPGPTLVVNNDDR